MVEDTHVVHSNNTNKPWVAYRVAATAFGRCNKKLNTKDDVKALQSVGDVIADLYMEYSKKGDTSMAKELQRRSSIPGIPMDNQFGEGLL